MRSPWASPKPESRELDSVFRAKLSLIRSFFSNGCPLTGFWPGCLSSQAPMTSTSNIVPWGVQTGFLKGCRLAAQKL